MTPTKPWDSTVAFVQRHRRVSLAFSTAITLASLLAAPAIPFKSGVAEYLPAGEPEVKQWLDLSRRFDAFDALMVGLEEPSGPLSREGLAALRRVTEKLGEQKASGILGARSLANIESVREAEDGSLVNELILPEIPKGQTELDALSRRLSADLVVTGAMVSRDQRGYAVLLRADPRRDSSEVARLVERVVEKERGPLSAFYFGAPFFTAQITKNVYAQLGWIVPAFVLLLLGVLAVGVRIPSVIALVLACAGLSLSWWLGLVRVLGLGLTQTSLNAALSLLVVAAVVFARGTEARLRSRAATPLPWPVAATLVSLAAAHLLLTRATVEYLAVFGATMAAGLAAILLFGLLAFAPAASLLTVRHAPAPRPARRWPAGRGMAVALAALVCFAWVGRGARFHLEAQDVFSAREEAGRALDFFDRRFGGTDVVQIGFRGSLRDPPVAARLMRLTDLLEGTDGFGDVRSVAQVLGFLAKGFGGIHRIPTQKEALDNLWFFLEGSTDVRNLVSADRTEAMVVVRIPLHPPRPLPALLEAAHAAVRESAETGPESARLRLLALARHFRFDPAPGSIEKTIAAAARPSPEETAQVSARVSARLQAFLASPDSPYQPTDAEWSAISEALAAPADARRAFLAEAVGGIEDLVRHGAASEFAETVLAREADLRLAARSQLLASALWEGRSASDTFQVRAAGVLADLLEPQSRGAAEVPVAVSGLPAVAGRVEETLRDGLWRAVLALLAAAALLCCALRVAWRDAAQGLLGGALATAATLAAGRLSGLEIDSGSAAVYLLPAALGFLATNGPPTEAPRRHTNVFLLALAAAACTLFFTGVLPVVRIGAVMAAGLCASAAVSYLSGRFGARTDATEAPVSG